jgi:hypothetical protein
VSSGQLDDERPLLDARRGFGEPGDGARCLSLEGKREKLAFGGVRHGRA